MNSKTANPLSNVPLRFYTHAVVVASREWEKRVVVFVSTGDFCAKISINCNFVRSWARKSLFSLFNSRNLSTKFRVSSKTTLPTTKCNFSLFKTFIGHWFYVTRSLSYILSSHLASSTSSFSLRFTFCVEALRAQNNRIA